MQTSRSAENQSELTLDTCTTEPRQFLRRHTFALGVGVIGLVICFWMITEGTGRLLVHHGFDTFYDGQADSLIHGRWDVTLDAISGEAFLIRGKYYGYFGFTPALLRIPLNLFFPLEYGKWSRLLMLLWIASVIAAMLGFMDEFELPSSAFLVAIAVLGSTLLFLCSNAITYNEAIMTGAALALWAYLFFCRYLKQARLSFLAAACMFSFLSFFARFTVGAGPLIFASFLCVALLFHRFARQRVMNWLGIPWPAAGRHAAFLALYLGITGATYLAVNHAKFGTWLNPAPYQYHVQYDAARLARIQGSINHLSNIPFSLLAYFGPGRIEFARSFPWLGLVGTGPGAGSAARIDWVANYSSIPAGMPALAILSILGVVVALANRSNRVRTVPILAAAFAAGCLVLPNAYIAYRYVHDFYPFLVIASIAGAAVTQSLSRKPLRWAVRGLIALAGIWSIAANIAFALKWQREDFGPEPAANAAFLRLRGRIDSMLPIGKVETIHYKIGDKLRYFRKGQLLVVADPPATYRYDGRQWDYRDGVPMHLFRLLVRFPPSQVGKHMPLWFAGAFGSSDAVYVVYSSPTSITFCSDQWGNGGACGSAIGIQPGREYHLRIDADRLNSGLTVRLDDRNVLTDTMQFHLWKNRDVLFGKSLAPWAHGADFAGELRKEDGTK